MSTTPEKPAPSKLTVIFAGEDISASLLDGSSTLVRVRAMPVRHLGQLLKLIDYEPELLELVCLIPAPEDQDDGSGVKGWVRVDAAWVDNLSEDSHLKLYEAAKRLNFSRAATWAERQIAAKQFSGELAFKAEEAIQPMIQKIVGLLASSSKLPESRVAALPKS